MVVSSLVLGGRRGTGVKLKCRQEARYHDMLGMVVKSSLCPSNAKFGTIDTLHFLLHHVAS